jgi:hypothetical protein
VPRYYAGFSFKIMFTAILTLQLDARRDRPKPTFTPSSRARATHGAFSRISSWLSSVLFETTSLRSIRPKLTVHAGNVMGPKSEEWRLWGP